MDALTERLEGLILKCLAWQSEDRLQSVRQLYEALVELYDPTAWTAADAEAFWRDAEKVRFSQPA